MIERLEGRLKDIREKGNYRQIRYIRPLSSTRIIYGSKECLNLCSNSYLSLHTHPEIIEAAREALLLYGAGTCSSRSVSGSIDLYKRLEEEVAKYKKYPRGLIFSNGYLANIGIISTLTERGDVIFSDELNHSSLIHSMRLTRAKKVIYKHRDMNDLEDRIKNDKSKGRRFLVTETIFSMDGDIAPLRDIYELKKRYDLNIIIDDAHGTGVFGEKGTGIEEMFGLSGEMDVHMATFGKALGSYGAFALAGDTVIEYLINRARTFMYTTALPPATIASSMKAIEIVKKDNSFKRFLWENIDNFRKGLKEAGFNLADSEGPIIPIIVGEDKKTVKMQEMLLEMGIFLQAIRPPTVPEGTSRLRLTIVRGFTKEDIDYAVSCLIKAGREIGLI
ncbi:MAG TPA: 8-amino-7-oxononanoate synthase [Syntrophorhabdaceae bacterium]|nr:8-amino-7-oxononanoate synthase [Syntrophorhabdaceae bacterium]HOT42582.1 8-amino-7-oxononanoate synthase [Syntrophorhabdaceae bacterium]HPC66160.1 8-amino-7-oxononanoate synthase [Syntrophorhabdaceae bacterium]HQE80629.1 8-amino-7-oxononanoate synthase [Syntrophorhabdaceae bacterium]HQH44037.1 8-amino-7-oxononanoate synthase [Syntrophorhabdaceae bacterium]